MFRRFTASGTAALLVIGTALSSAQQGSPAPAPPAASAAQTAPEHAPPQASQPPKPNTLLDGTPVKLRLGRTISSADAKAGDEVDFEVLEDVEVNGIVVIAKDGRAIATVTEAEPKRRMGRGGKLNVNIDSVRLVDQEKAALRATEGGKGGGHVGAMTGAMVAMGIVFLPAAPLFLLMHGKDITISKGTEVTAYISGDMTLEMARFNPEGSAPEKMVAVLSVVTIDANQLNCDIDVDGSFIGNTPSQLSLASGNTR